MNGFSYRIGDLAVTPLVLYVIVSEKSGLWTAKGFYYRRSGSCEWVGLDVGAFDIRDASARVVR